MRNTFYLVALVSTIACNSNLQNSHTGFSPDWMIGSWIDTENGNTETWIKSDSGLVGYSTNKSDTLEFMLIKFNDSLNVNDFCAWPHNQADACFTINTHSDSSWHAKRRGEGSPQWISYSATGTKLTAHIGNTTDTISFYFEKAR